MKRGEGAAGRAYLTYNLSLRSLTSLFVVLSGGQTALVDCYYVHSLLGIGHTKLFSVLFSVIFLVFVKHLNLDWKGYIYISSR